MSGVELIAKERQRQIDEEGHSAEYDDEFYPAGSLAIAGACYALDAFWAWGGFDPLKFWPWHPNYWKPTRGDPIRQLTKAGALIAAEIDKLERQRVHDEGIVTTKNE